MISPLSSAIYTLIITHVAVAKIAPFLEQGFQFDYTPTAAPVPVPTTTQCEEIPLNWGPGPFNGPDPVAPYYIQVYTSSFLFPMVINVGEGRTFNWPVPYIPGTLYQICMFASNGVTGGCQRSYTVIPAANTTLENPPICQNLTYPQGILDVEASDHTGDLSQYAWVDQCTDIQLKPLNGTPPFTMTVASTLHPPTNITSQDMSPLNWTVQLSWGSQFWISLVDANGVSWAFGPLHSGGDGPTECLSLSTSSTTASGSSGLSPGIAAGAGIGGIAVGLAAGALIAWLILKHKMNQRHSIYDVPEDRIHRNAYKQEALDSPGDSRGDQYAPVPLSGGSPRESEAELISIPRSRSLGRGPLIPGSGYEVEPFRMPGDVLSDDVSTQHHGMSEHGGLSGAGPTRASRGATSEASSSSGPRTSEAGAGMPHVYVVHHDAGRAPVTVFTPQGTEVIELPPRYEGGSTSATSSGASAGSASSQPNPTILGVRNADPGSLPRKLPPSPGGGGG